MSDLVISEAKPWHCGQIARRMRKAHTETFERAGSAPHPELRAIFDASHLCRVAFRDGVLLAIWGVTGPLASTVGFVWMALTEDGAKHPVLVFREAKRQIRAMMGIHKGLEAMVLTDDHAAMRFADHIGFQREAIPEMNIGNSTAAMFIYGGA